LLSVESLENRSERGPLDPFENRIVALEPLEEGGLPPPSWPLLQLLEQALGLGELLLVEHADAGLPQQRCGNADPTRPSSTQRRRI